MENKKVVILGAGVAGLVAAQHLEQAGHAPLLIEGSDRIGGRVKTDLQSGFLLDHGFQVLLTGYNEAKRYLDFGSLDLKTFSSGAIIFNAKEKLRLADPLREPSQMLTMLFSKVGSLRDKWLLFRLSQELKKIKREDIFSPESTQQTTLAFLREYSFSAKLIENFFRPFFGGIFLENDLTTPAAMFRFVFKMFSEGEAAIPARGMEQIAQQLFNKLQKTELRVDTRIKKIEYPYLYTEVGDSIQFDKLIIATDPQTLLPNLRDTVPGYQHTSNLYFRAEPSPLPSNTIALVSKPGSIINNFCVLTEVSPAYASSGGHLLSVTLKDIPAGDQLKNVEDKVVKEFKDLTGYQGSLEYLTRYDIPKALPVNDQPAYSLPHTQFSLTDDIYLAGDYLLNASLDAAMRSGRLAAQALLDSL
jgi:protoporphyrinogen oxidase